MNRTAYICPVETFNSYLKPVLTSFVEYKVNVSGCVPESFIPVLTRFDHHCMAHPEDEICLKQDIIHSFLKQKTVKKSTLQRIESIIRSFGRYMVLVLRIDDTYVLPHLIHHRGKTFVPYVFTTNEISQLFNAADNYRLKIRNKPTTNLVNCIRCMIKMLYCTGMRVSEACYLKVSDVDLENNLIYINHAKNDNHRVVTISLSLSSDCNRYLKMSKHHHNSSVYFFDSGAAFKDGFVSPRCVYVYFRRYLRLANIKHKGTGFGPRLHDLRVTFAVHSLKKLTENTTDVNAALAYLSAFMGHHSLHETQDYLWLSKDLYSSTLAKMESYTSFISEIFDEKVGENDE
jgi:integrase